MDLSRIFRLRSVDTVLAENGGLAPGFDLLRLGLALLIFNAHAGGVIAGWAVEDLPTAERATSFVASAWNSWREPIYIMLVPIFFALSGFLVTGSAFRTRSVRNFLAFRALRIFPALSIEVTLSALVLGPLFTTLPLWQYFTDWTFLRYFGNIFGFVAFHLPGVFETNPIPGIVNSNLWTLPPEFYCYLITATAMFATALYNKRLFTALFVIATLALAPLAYTNGYVYARGNLPGPMIVYYFFCGALFFHWREKIPVGLPALVALGPLAFAMFYFRADVFLTALTLTYFTVAIGSTRFPRLPLIHRGDYSYGIYLYGFPIAQALVAAFPYFRDHGWSFRIVAFTLTIAFAVTSWHLLEKPALKLKSRLVRSPKQLVGEGEPVAAEAVDAARPVTAS